MPVYAYKGVASGGRAARGFVDAENPRAARARLRRDGIFPTEVSEDVGQATTIQTRAASTRRVGVRRISALDLALATRQLATLVGAGIPLVSALGALSDQVESPRLKAALGGVRDRVNEGASLAEALAESGPFSPLYVSMVRAGEAGGALETVLERLADYLESQERLRSKVISILAYPLAMFAFAGVVAVILVTVVLPQITQLLTSLNRELPLLTRLITGASQVARDWWWAFGLAALGAGFALRFWLRTERGRERWDALRLRLPVFGRVTRQIAIARFSRTLGTLLAGGIPITRALEISKHVTANVVIGQSIDAATESVTGGSSLAGPLRQSGHFPPLVTHMIEVGEQSGELEAMLAKVADTYDAQVETTVQRLTALLEPLLILVMVGLVVMIILSVLQPLLEVTTSIQG
jgi:general secretion pathway protein F